MVFTIMVMVVCATFAFFSPLCSNAQFSTVSIEQHVLDPCPFYVFGDSLYDTGMAFYIDKGPVADSYPYGTTYFRRPAGRFSDGRLIPDFIAQFANLPFPEPYFKPNFTDFSKSVNFADAAAGVLVDGRPNTLNLELQTDYYVEMVGKMEKEYGVEKTAKLVSNAVHIFNTGANDYVDLWNQNAKPLDPSLVNSLVNKILGNFTLHLTRMYYQGARKFAFHGFGPVGCLPGFLEDDGSCSESLNELMKLHNEKFAPMAATWARKLPGFKYTIYDFYTSLSARIANGTKYGFEETQRACCGSGPFNGKFSCMDKVNFTLCEEPTKHLWFDAGHPSEKADFQFAQEFWGGPPHLVHPFNLKSLFDLDTSA
ncbi:hypothetical protein RND81_06G245800 [Saponaria officinalis]|uniref:Uncharacterized protein n=1 Tax=Saponaria officinalis TaxID=3572 RepID=A0AAW1KEF7_SAPOF